MDHLARAAAALRVLALGAALGAAPSHAAAQASLIVQGVADAELWVTDSGSVLLTRNNGRPAALGRIHVWAATELSSRLLVYAAGTLEGGKGRSEPGTEWYTDIIGLRYVRSEALVIDAGKLPHPVGEFASRRYSTRNPLIGAPDAYPVGYPLGAQLSGTRGRVDYRAALVSMPVYHEDYVPDPTASARPAVGVGLTFAPGVRVGASATWGPYLNCDLPQTLLAGRSWRRYSQRVGTVDAQVSRGYLEVRAELGATRYDVPAGAGARPNVVRALAYYGEAKYTLTPRLFVAARVERNNYAYIQPVSDVAWVANPTDMYNVEVGAGYRLGAQTLIKASVRGDTWRVPPAMRTFLPNGAAFAMQLSRAFDVFEASRSPR